MSKNAAAFNMEALPSTGLAAAAVGSPYFFTGRPCHNGHLYMRYTKGGRCAFCQRERNAEKRGVKFDPTKGYAARYVARMAASKTDATTYVPVVPCKHGHSLRFVGSNNCVLCDKALRQRHRISGRFARIKREYGLTKADYLALVEKQASSCAICSRHEHNHFSLHVDHDHFTGKVRGLLCSRCNQAIGLMAESRERMQAAIEYLDRHAA